MTGKGINMTGEDSRSLAQQLFDADMLASNYEDKLYTEILRICGYDFEEPETWPFHKITWDSYDGSFELKCDVISQWKPTDTQMRECFGLGFSQAWICYGDRDNDLGYSELYYNKKDL
jgi:hypothetical protein